jgi:tRNA A37 N6-isopentenylltransferase MiaA
MTKISPPKSMDKRERDRLTAEIERLNRELERLKRLHRRDPQRIARALEQGLQEFAREAPPSL